MRCCWFRILRESRGQARRGENCGFRNSPDNLSRTRNHGTIHSRSCHQPIFWVKATHSTHSINQARLERNLPWNNKQERKQNYHSKVAMKGQAN